MRYDCTVHSVNDSLGLCFEAVYVVNLIFRRVRPWDIFVQEACKTVDYGKINIDVRIVSIVH